MRSILFFFSTILVIWSCSNKGSNQTASTFCDTTCTTETFNFEGNHKFKPYVSISQKNCTGDTITWSHGALPAGRQMHLGTLLGNLVRLNSAAINCFIKDTSYAWVSFNDCSSGRGYLMHLPFNKKESVRKMSSAINSFDKRFVLPEDLRAYCDYSTIYVEDINTGAKAQMTFQEEYKIDFNAIHETVDTVNISRNRIFIQLLKDGKKIPLEKTITL